ncbi:H+-transporting two-sector ATPase, B/B' subunit [Afipia carboxidovorans OM5]|uniref:ATP synthase subunit b 2 n=1 Tax=Afipia carboxidovorans (strain ATCC 49405 / DSM 1227 / KCTC 32145 / OM5) TaxID=504832 RepID=ATPF2_AFIC5|nr:ATP synthase subunit b 2 [Afipia carboxidovorans]B6JDC8.1 RecName: Full=ATP synthase subunit b 2; AltName: Full=ATP synthase F(0) sector subunit b 2; AltName: Full=ATPase subunit I 2; AltName: Full=F-type ATPase subunit b 2; Short=F-ATPase subunit b 2 [Afipia carboxidovorans OM5]ACI91840.1 H+-transporting two-sector ATPase, B/B' subunit [Afipia carboxidovorans OM5]AEI04298.1 ATP synthase subunit b/b' [Afipia carboxidovorans OM4]AEI07928.1 ATP synthase subunit b/b' [Afipia carboxidovorans OM5
MAESHATGTTTHTEVPHGKPEFPPFNKDTFASQLVSFAIAFALLYVIVSRFALPRVGGVIKTREGTIEKDLAEAQAFRDESDLALKAYETELAAARTRAQAIGSETRDTLAAQSDAERKAVELSLSAKLAEAEKTISDMRTKAMGNVKAIAADATSAIVQQLSGTAPDAQLIDRAVDASLKGGRDAA